MCPHTTIYVSSYYSVCVFITSCVLIPLYLYAAGILLHMRAHTTIYVTSYYYTCPHTTIYVFSCVLMLVSRRHPTPYASSLLYVSSYYYVCVLMPLYVSSYVSSFYFICVIMLQVLYPGGKRWRNDQWEYVGVYELELTYGVLILLNI